MLPRGDELAPKGEDRCNIWQGTFPARNTVEDGNAATAPVGACQPNGYVLYSTSGNVWGWCGDWSSTAFHIDGSRSGPEGRPTGGSEVIRDGSYLCHESYRYRVAARSQDTLDSSTGNMGSGMRAPSEASAR